MSKDKLRISLEANGIHSLIRGLDTFSSYEEGGKGDDFLLKESIMFLHHGIELLMKQVLINKGSGEHLIFSELGPSTTRKILQAKQEKKSVFSLDKPPQTATYLEAIDRIQAFVESPIVDPLLESLLKELNTLRNNIEHYGIDTDKSKVEVLLFRLKHIITPFFEKGGVEFNFEYEEKWAEIEKQVVLAVSKLRGASFVKQVKVEKDSVVIEYVKSIDEHKKMHPESRISKESFDSYWNTGNTILKALNDGSVRLLRSIEGIEEVKIVLPVNNEIYTICVKRSELEKFLDSTVQSLQTNWNGAFSDPFVYSKDGAKKFFEHFGTILSLGKDA